jgi:hypothetical protein
MVLVCSSATRRLDGVCIQIWHIRRLQFGWKEKGTEENSNKKLLDPNGSDTGEIMGEVGRKEWGK